MTKPSSQFDKRANIESHDLRPRFKRTFDNGSSARSQKGKCNLSRVSGRSCLDQDDSFTLRYINVLLLLSAIFLSTITDAVDFRDIDCLNSRQNLSWENTLMIQQRFHTAQSKSCLSRIKFTTMMVEAQPSGRINVCLLR